MSTETQPRPDEAMHLDEVGKEVKEQEVVDPTIQRGVGANALTGAVDATGQTDPTSVEAAPVDPDRAAEAAADAVGDDKWAAYGGPNSYHELSEVQPGQTVDSAGYIQPLVQHPDEQTPLPVPGQIGRTHRPQDPLGMR